MRAATLLVVEKFDLPEINLGVDDHDEPIAELRRIWGKYRNEVDNFVLRVLDPDKAI